MTSETTMPDPVVEVDKHIVSSELQYTYLAPSGGLEHGTQLITTDQAEAYANARVREALGKLDDQIDLQCSKLQTDDETHDFWMGVGAAVTVAQNVIADSMPDDK